MASKYNLTASEFRPQLIELSEFDETYSMSEEEPTQRDFNNRRLTQALNYLNEEGGVDSPATFIDRVNRIDDALLQQLPQQGVAFDDKLFRRVRTMVLDVQRDFENAAQEATPQLESDEDLPEYSTPIIAEEALYRASDSLPSPSPAPTRPARAYKDVAPSRSGTENVDRERKFKYGGPHNEVENWHKDHPAILPFPETLLMAHWESMKIDFDLSRSKENTVVETDVPFDHEQLKPYFSLAQYESGSGFRHPAVSKEVQQMVSRYGTAIRLESAVETFNKGGATECDVEKYCPRAVLEEFAVGNQVPPNVVSPNQIRQAMATTPTKPRVLSTGGTGMVPSKLDSLYETDNNPGKHPEDQPMHLAQGASSSKSHTRTTPARAGPAIRAFEKKVRRSSGAQAAAERSALAKKPSPIRTVTHVEIPKRGRGCPGKSSLISEISPVPNTPIESSLGKRKPSASSQPYSPPKSSIKKVLRDAKRQKVTPSKTVDFVEAPAALEEDSE